MSAPINIKLSVQSKEVITCMCSNSIHGNVKIDLETGEEDELVKPKTYWFMPCVFEETKVENEFLVHELPESITKQILDFIRQ